MACCSVMARPCAPRFRLRVGVERSSRLVSEQFTHLPVFLESCGGDRSQLLDPVLELLL